MPNLKGSANITMGMQKDIVQCTVDKGADYVLVLIEQPDQPARGGGIVLFQSGAPRTARLARIPTQATAASKRASSALAFPFDALLIVPCHKFHALGGGRQ